MSRRYARGKFAKAECARSGKIMPLNRLVRDGLYPNLLVAPDWWEPPYFKRPVPDASDATALYRPSPRRDAIDTVVRFPLFDVASGRAGPALFSLFDVGLDLHAVALRVALYRQRPGFAYDADGELDAPGYAPGGQALDTVIEGGELQIGDSVWATASISAAWLLVYDEDSGKALIRVNLGSEHASVNGEFRIQWASARYRLNAAGTTIALVIC
ncbi:hypothetical protein [Salinisphaera hydrothermalis]|uniref:Uncharacterized protein n=1 Tax=Salinisphaera hydrothermalis (strain C41B8) TaxID=1304275 RepID=A0A084INM4_SALHC|nr:hypothetical protein [Salinisphaera hydrothermalis]KEZ78308.1 hypothetical protein C41B8_05383 [Salinisphaera hydrothermalis C41B8]